MMSMAMDVKIGRLTAWRMRVCMDTAFQARLGGEPPKAGARQGEGFKAKNLSGLRALSARNAQSQEASERRKA
jgi:hypothetical protein